MSEEKQDSLDVLAFKFAEKNPDLLRDIMSSHFFRMTEVWEFTQGKLVKTGKAEKHYKTM